MADQQRDLEYDLYFDEADEFVETELDYMESKQWGDLLNLYEREADRMPDEEDASDLRSRIELIRKRMYEDAKDSQY